MTSNTQTTAQRKAQENYRTRLAESGMARFEILGLDTDRSLLRTLARRLAQTMRRRTVCGPPYRKA